MVGVLLYNLSNRELFCSWDIIVGYINEETQNRYKQLYEANKENQLEDNTTIYLTPLANFPPYKLKNYIEENKLKIKGKYLSYIGKFPSWGLFTLKK